MDSKEIAKAKVEKALRLIDHASGLLSEACGELSTIIHANKQWTMVGNHYDLIRQLARDVNYTVPRSKIDLDSDEKARLAKGE